MHNKIILSCYISILLGLTNIAFAAHCPAPDTFKNARLSGLHTCLLTDQYNNTWLIPGQVCPPTKTYNFKRADINMDPGPMKLYSAPVCLYNEEEIPLILQSGMKLNVHIKGPWTGSEAAKKCYDIQKCEFYVE